MQPIYFVDSKSIHFKVKFVETSIELKISGGDCILHEKWILVNILLIIHPIRKSKF